MQKCLGIYIEDNIIKYAKVSKDKKTLKVEAFGIKVFESLTNEIEKIVEETFSFNDSISINLTNEKYIYFDIFSLLNKKDVQKAVQTEFESFCDERKYNQNAFETRYALVQNIEDKEKIKAIDICVNKIELNKQIQMIGKHKLGNISPIGMTIPNIAKLDRRVNTLIVNMEENTSITTITGNQIYNVETLEIGSRDVLSKINKMENSYARAYEICKNTTIYTADVGVEEEQIYLQHIVPTLYEISQKIKEILQNPVIKIQKIYLTGTLAMVNNVDLYFQEFFPNIEVKILKPNFIEETSSQINIKDYVEVNSAISLAIQNLDEGLKGINFRKASLMEKLFADVDTSKIKGKMPETNIKIDFKAKLEPQEVMLLRVMAGIVLIGIIYSSFSAILNNQMKAKEKEIDGLISSQNSEIAKVEADTASLNSKITKYNQKLQEVEKINERISDIASSKNTIPNLLNQIMFIIPESVQITSIQNTTDKHVVIQAKATQYEQLGYFIAKIKSIGALNNVVSSSGMKNGEEVSVNIEGDL